jgi:hypothetical protein
LHRIRFRGQLKKQLQERIALAHKKVVRYERLDGGQGAAILVQSRPDNGN